MGLGIAFGVVLNRAVGLPFGGVCEEKAGWSEVEDDKEWLPKAEAERPVDGDPYVICSEGEPKVFEYGVWALNLDGNGEEEEEEERLGIGVLGC